MGQLYYRASFPSKPLPLVPYVKSALLEPDDPVQLPRVEHSGDYSPRRILWRHILSQVGRSDRDFSLRMVV